MKYCPSCKQDKREDDFHQEPKRVDGLASNCKECKNARNRANWRNRYYPEHRAELIAAVIRRRKKRDDKTP